MNINSIFVNILLLIIPYFMKKNILSLLLFLSVLFSTYSQVQVGDGALTDQKFPIYTTSTYSYSQSIYLSTEINASGTITAIQWYYNGTGTTVNTPQLTIYMGTTSESVFTSSSDWEPIANLTPVYSGGININSTPGWKTITLTTPFVYNGTGNLIVAVDGNQIAYTTASDVFYNTPVTGLRSICCGSIGQDINPANPPTTSGSGNYLSFGNFIPNIIFNGITQLCQTPNYLTSSNLNTTTATISWQAPTTTATGGSDYYISTSDTAPNANTIPSGSIASGNNTLNLTSLTPGTAYHIWVRNNCGNGIFSNWSTMLNFSTLCASTMTFNENFDGITAPQLPNCWTKIIRGPSINPTGTVIETSSVIANQVFSAPNSIKMFNSNASTATNDIILVSPSLSTLDLTTYRLKFYAKQVNVTGIIQVGTLNSSINTAIFTPLPGYENMVITNSSTEYTVNFSGYTGTDNYIGIRMKTASLYATTLLDNIRWELTPICPDVSNIIVPEVNATGAQITWQSGGTETSWDVAVGPSTATDPNVLTFENTSIPLKNIIGLNSTTGYKVWVRSVCTVGGNGAWIGPVSFTTDCAGVATLNENFDGVATPQLPNCWSKIIRGSSINPTFTVIETSSLIAGNVLSGPNSVKMSNSSASTTTNDIILVSPNLTTLNLATHRLKFYAKQNVIINTASIIVGTLNTSTNTATFTPLETVYLTVSPTEYIVDFIGYNGTDTHIGIKMSSLDNNINVYLDNIHWEINPTCQDVSNIVVPTTTATGATVTWVSDGDATAWQVVVGLPTVTDPGTLTPINATATTANITGLTSLTTYNVWVRSVCDGNDYGAWIGPTLFTTACPSVTTIDENFDTVTIPNLPLCWSKIINGPTSSPYSEVVTKSNNSYSGSNSVQLVKSSYDSGENNVILVTPGLSNIFSGNYRLRFYARQNPNGNPASVQIGTLNGNTNSADFSPIINIPLTNVYTEYVVNFDVTLGTDSYIGFRNSTADATTVYLENIRWELIPTCPDVTNIIVNATTTTGASVVWTETGTEVSWDVAFGLPSVTDPTSLTYENTTVPSKIITALTPNTTYKVWVRSVCAGGNGAWVGPITFTTACNAVTTLNENFDSITTPNLPLCWTKILRGPSLSVTADVFTIANNSYSPTNSILMRNTTSGADDEIILVSPNLSTLAAETHQLKFYSNSTIPLQIGTLDNNTNSATFTPLLTIYPANNNYTQHSVNFSTYTGTDTYIGIRLDSTTPYSVVNIDNITFEANLNTNQFDLSQLSYYPNPVKNVLNISYISDISAVSVYNLLGQEVVSKSINGNLAKVDMSSLAKGTYMVKISADNLVKTIKVLKEE